MYLGYSEEEQCVVEVWSGGVCVAWFIGGGGVGSSVFGWMGKFVYVTTDFIFVFINNCTIYVMKMFWIHVKEKQVLFLKLICVV